jgi:hypothetical protein
MDSIPRIVNDFEARKHPYSRRNGTITKPAKVAQLCNGQGVAQ